MDSDPHRYYPSPHPGGSAPRMQIPSPLAQEHSLLPPIQHHPRPGQPNYEPRPPPNLPPLSRHPSDHHAHVPAGTVPVAPSPSSAPPQGPSAPDPYRNPPPEQHIGRAYEHRVDLPAANYGPLPQMNQAPRPYSNGQAPMDPRPPSAPTSGQMHSLPYDLGPPRPATSLPPGRPDGQYMSPPVGPPHHPGQHPPPPQQQQHPPPPPHYVQHPQHAPQQQQQQPPPPPPTPQAHHAPPPMDYGPHHGPPQHGPPQYGPPPHESRVNGTHVVPHMVHVAPEPQPQAQQAYGPSYQVPPPSFFTAHVSAVGKRKHIRAQQACDNCRSRKQKCDEARPCQFCKENSFPCNYRDIPVPKQDRMMESVQTSIKSFEDRFTGLERAMKRIESVMLKRLGSGGLKSERDSPITDRLADDIDPTEPDDSAEAMELSMEMDPNAHQEAYISPAQPSSTDMVSPPDRMMSVSIPAVPHAPHEPGPGVVQRSAQAQIDHGPPVIPYDHHTPAHLMLFRWETVKPFGDEIEGLNHETFIEKLERDRGSIRWFGYGEGMVETEGANLGPGSPSTSSQGDDMSSVSSPADGSQWGYGFSPRPEHGYGREEFSSVGGLMPDGTLKLDLLTMNELRKSYEDHIHVMLPFLDKRTFQEHFNDFRKHLKSAKPPAPAFVDEPPAKRARIADSAGSPGEHMRLHEQKQKFEKKVSSAIVLLVLALGKICQHKQFLQGPASKYSTPLPQHTLNSSFTSNQASPPAGFKQSPSMSNSTAPTSVPSPIQNFRPSKSRRSSMEGTPQFAEKQLRNVDVIPGLAYYIEAAEILGLYAGGTGISHAHAFLLASLYTAQLLRVWESHRWIIQAAGVIANYFNSESPDLIEQTKKALRMPYLATMMCDGDIRAEMSKYQECGLQTMPDPGPPSYLDIDPSEMDNEQASESSFFFNFQHHFRKYLNTTHSICYSNQASRELARDPFPKFREVTEHDRSFLDLRILLNNLGRGWEDKEPPVLDDINVARIRGKFYGGRYITLRVFVDYALHRYVPPENFPAIVAAHYPEYQRGLNQDGYAQRSTPVSRSRFGVDLGSGKHLTEAEFKVLVEHCRTCLEMARQSTIAFDGFIENGKRPIVTNLFGTAQAQFGNVLVLAAVVNSWLGFLLDRTNVLALIDRTIRFLKNLAPLSPPMRKEVEVLERTRRIVNLEISYEPRRPTLSQNGYSTNGPEHLSFRST